MCTSRGKVRTKNSELKTQNSEGVCASGFSRTWGGAVVTRTFAGFAAAVALGAGVGLAQAPTPTPQVPVPPEAQKHVTAAQAAAGADHPGVWKAVCDTALALRNP